MRIFPFVRLVFEEIGARTVLYEEGLAGRGNDRRTVRGQLRGRRIAARRNRLVSVAIEERMDLTNCQNE